MINYDTKNCIIVAYPPGAGGNFLINSLALSKHAVMSDKDLAEQQLAGSLTSVDKLEILKTRIQNSSNTHWNDLKLGILSLTGVTPENYYTLSKEQIDQTYYDVVHTLSNSDYKFFLMAHDKRSLEQICKIWNNPTIILFENTKKFVGWRSYGYGVFKNVTAHSFIEFSIDVIPKKYTTHLFDGSAYFNKSDTLKEIEKIYNLLGLPDFDENLIGQYSDTWKAKLAVFKTTALAHNNI